ncbi:hypothetical protein BDB01DRAFT_810346 [Pilobolus umbonatus]|nr:hypothetical protein BDB01DRAFT_810346 [Pilobolus umbonatus]
MTLFDSNYDPLIMNRISLASCRTEDSVESSSVTTPIAASPLHPLSTTFSIINIVNNDPLPDAQYIPSIAAIHNNRPPPPPRVVLPSTTRENKGKISRLWPKIKRMLSQSRSDPEEDTMKILNEGKEIKNNRQNSNRRWMKNKSQVAPQR